MNNGIMEVLRFPDGYSAYVFNGNRKGHFLLRPGETVSFSCQQPQPEYIMKEMKITYREWNKRYGIYSIRNV